MIKKNIINIIKSILWILSIFFLLTNNAYAIDANWTGIFVGLLPGIVFILLIIFLLFFGIFKGIKTKKKKYFLWIIPFIVVFIIMFVGSNGFGLFNKSKYNLTIKDKIISYDKDVTNIGNKIKYKLNQNIKNENIINNNIDALRKCNKTISDYKEDNYDETYSNFKDIKYKCILNQKYDFILHQKKKVNSEYKWIYYTVRYKNTECGWNYNNEKEIFIFNYCWKKESLFSFEPDEFLINFIKIMSFKTISL